MGISRKNLGYLRHFRFITGVTFLVGLSFDFSHLVQAETTRWQRNLEILGGDENSTTDLTPEKSDQPNILKEFPPNPLEILVPDPLLPDFKKPLNAQEKAELKTKLDQLNLEASQQLQLGNIIPAFEIWNREIRLRRALGTKAELEALGRVGQFAWDKNQTTEVRYINERLQTIQKDILSQKLEENQEKRQDLLMALGMAYRQIRSRDLAVIVYQKIAAMARENQDLKLLETTLNTIGDLHLNWFDYPQAVATYRELLILAQNQGDRVKEVTYLKQLIYLHDRARKAQEALDTKLMLAGVYLDQKQMVLIPPLQIAIAADYITLNQLNQAAKTYQDAYALAWSLQQYNYASEALQKLADLYKSRNQIPAALQVYQILLDVEQRSYNVYGLMNTYDQIGQIYQSRQAYPQALSAFQNGLNLAKKLGYREDYFTNQIEQVNRTKPK